MDLQTVETEYKAKIKKVQCRVDCWNNGQIPIVRPDSCLSKEESSSTPVNVSQEMPVRRGISGEKPKSVGQARKRVDEKLSNFKEAVKLATS